MQKLYFLLNSKEGTIYEQLMMLRDNIIFHRFCSLIYTRSCFLLRDPALRCGTKPFQAIFDQIVIYR